MNCSKFQDFFCGGCGQEGLDINGLHTWTQPQGGCEDLAEFPCRCYHCGWRGRLVVHNHKGHIQVGLIVEPEPWLFAGGAD